MGRKDGGLTCQSSNTDVTVGICWDLLGNQADAMIWWKFLECFFSI